MSRYAEDYAPWIVGFFLLFALGPAILLLRKLYGALAQVPAKLKKAFSNPVLDGVSARLALTRKVCPVRMFTNDPKDPTYWLEGRFEGRMLGVLDRGVVWLGAPDSATLCAFGRDPQGAWIGRDFTGNEANPLLKDAALLALLSAFSGAVASVSVLGDALEAGVAWKGAQTEALLADIRTLSAFKDRIEALDSPLVRAVMRGDEAAAQALIRAGADLEALSIGYLNALTAAAAAGKTGLVKLLLAAGAKVQPESGFPLHAAARAGHLETVKALVDAGASVDALDARGATALIEAAKDGREDVVAFLLSKGADVDAAD
ncbi:MAG: ankyrin repeat domain-containing protein [Elusimicrobiota bacterium]